MRFMGLMFAVTAIGVTSQAYAPPLNIATGPLCPPGAAGDCCQAHPEPGCDDPACCELVCTVVSPLCCIDGFGGWVQACADAAEELCKICQPIVGSAVNMATGPDPSVDGYLRVGADEYGSYSSLFLDPDGLGDTYNPAGPDAGGLGPLEATFVNGFMIFVDDFPPDGIRDRRELLSLSAGWQGSGCGFLADGSMDRIVTTANVASDTNADGVDDMLTSSFEVLGGSTDLLVDVEQEVDSVPGNSIALLTQRYTITSIGPDPVDFNLVRLGDFDLFYNGTGLGDDSVGTDRAVTNNAVFLQEDSTPATRITMVSPEAVDYTGSILGITPSGGPPAFGFATGCDTWDAFGLPATWADEIAAVGNKTNGESGAAPTGCTGSCDAHIELNIPVVELGVGQSVTITIRHLYGGTCQWDCESLPDGQIGITDFLKLLADWGNASACDFDGGGVGITDFLKLLANWGPCP